MPLPITLLGLLLACAAAAGARAAAAPAPAPAQAPGFACPWTDAKARATLENDLAFSRAPCAAPTDAVVAAALACDAGAGGAVAAGRAGGAGPCAPACDAYRVLLDGACFDALATELFELYALINATAEQRRELPAELRLFWSAQLEVGRSDCPANANTDPGAVDASILRRARNYAAAKRHKYGACVPGAGARAVAEVEAEAEAAAAALPLLSATPVAGAARRAAAAAAAAAALAAAALA
jgi:hypothetical protein